jgi:hypothetical protein
MTPVCCSTTAIHRPAMAFRLIPAGRFRANDGRPSGISGWLMDGDSARRIIAALATQKNDLLIDYEHQSLRTQETGKPAPAAGWFKQLAWREGDGLYVIDARWTRNAAAMLSAQEYRYISPVFHFDDVTGRVLSILGAAITNTPGLDGLTDLAALKANLPVASRCPSDFTDEASYRAYLKAAAAGIVRINGRDPLSTAQRAVCTHMGIKPEDYLANLDMRPVNPNANDKDLATMKHVFGADFLEQAAAQRNYDVACSVPPAGVSERDHINMQAAFGKDYAIKARMQKQPN